MGECESVMASIGESLRAVARNLIDNVFGNTITVYSFADATVNTNDEGDEDITWGETGTVANGVMNELIPNMIEMSPQFEST